MTDPRDRVRDLITDAVRREQFEPRLDAILRELVDVIDTEPELRRAVIRESLRSSIWNGIWLRS